MLHLTLLGFVRRGLRLFLPLLAGVMIGVFWPVLLRPAPVLNQDAAYPGASAVASWSTRDGGVIQVRPRAGQATRVLVVYPGGRVPPQSYQWLGTALALHRVETVIVRFPLDLAVTGINRADGVIRRYGQGRPVFLAGHSLGGAMAAQYLNSPATVGTVRGLILMGAYPPGRVRLQDRTDVRVLTLLAEHDQVASATRVRQGLKQLPPETRLVTVRGAVHAFFGRYGPQAGDGQPTVARSEAEAQMVRTILAFLDDDAQSQVTPAVK